ncbi:hypothetical protein O6H91_13G061300 [Diphasiastrum complanatum]|uniref:Uncharacterized protein n=1 Tax=Diphasiastrum complanatum TaxID=34168 RepID=A0ACC2BVC1_DIPCM|nr:hypothetical protein O6H91_13G061300 [Diphasiastrum complanatum]
MVACFWYFVVFDQRWKKAAAAMEEEKEALIRLFSEASSASRWSLHSSIQIQDWLENFAKRMTRRANHVAAQVSNLVDQTSRVEQDLHNTYNNFRLLSNIQFVENRVLDEDETTTTGVESTRHVQEQEIPLESYESQIIPRYKEAAFTAWNAYDQSGKRVSRLSPLVVSQRDHYRQSLPYIIGSEDFERNADCGLRENLILEASKYDDDFETDGATSQAKLVISSVTTDIERSTTGSDASDVEHLQRQGEPVVSAALDFKAMLEAALRGPYVTYDGLTLSYNKGNTDDHNYNSAGELDSVPGIGSSEGDITAKAVPFSATRTFAEGLPSNDLVKSGRIAHAKRETSSSRTLSSDSSLEDKLTINMSMVDTLTTSLPSSAKKIDEGAFAGVPSDLFSDSKLPVIMQRRQGKDVFSTEDRDNPSSERVLLTDDVTKSEEPDIASDPMGHIDDGAIDAFDLDLFRKFKTLTVDKGHGDGGLFDDDFDEVTGGLYGAMDSSIYQNLVMGEQDMGVANEKNEDEERIDSAPLNDILSRISMEEPLAGIDSKSEGNKIKITKYGQRIVPASTWESFIGSKKQINEWAQSTIGKSNEKAALVLGPKISKLSDSTNDDSSFSSSNGQPDEETIQLKHPGEALTLVESEEDFMNLKQESGPVNPLPDFISSNTPLKSQGGKLFSGEVLSSQASNLGLTTEESIHDTSIPKELLSDNNTTDTNIKNHGNTLFVVLSKLYF